MIRVTGSNSLLMSSLNTDTENNTKVAELLEKTSGTDKTQESHKTNGVNSSKYNAVKTSASELKTLASKLTSEDAESIFAVAEETSDKTGVTDTIEDFVKKYNALMNSLDDLGTTKSDNYRTELKSIIASKSDELKKIGITSNADGTLQVDSDTLNKAELADLKALFQGTSSIASKILEKSVYIGANATADQYVDSCSNYNAGGTAADYAQMVNMIGSYLDSMS